MQRYEITFINSKEDWIWHIIEAKDFHDACVNALASCELRKDEGLRLIRVEETVNGTL